MFGHKTFYFVRERRTYVYGARGFATMAEAQANADEIKDRLRENNTIGKGETITVEVLSAAGPSLERAAIWVNRESIPVTVYRRITLAKGHEDEAQILAVSALFSMADRLGAHIRNALHNTTLNDGGERVTIPPPAVSARELLDHVREMCAPVLKDDKDLSEKQEPSGG